MKQLKYFLAGAMSLIGLLVSLGVLDFRYNNGYTASFRVMFGLVLMLMGVYRLVNLSRKEN